MFGTGVEVVCVGPHEAKRVMPISINKVNNVLRIILISVQDKMRSKLLHRCIALRLLYDEQKVHAVNPEESDRDVGDDGDDLAFKVVQELFQLALIGCHLEVEAVDAIFGRHVKLLSWRAIYQRLSDGYDFLQTG
jgi:hypothetical protein